jgi:hypothetical protein
LIGSIVVVKGILIRESMSLCMVSILITQKRDGYCRMCIYSLELNKITSINRFPLPSMDDLMDNLCGTKYFFEINMKSGYH